MNNMNNILGTMADAYEADAFNVLTHYRGTAADSKGRSRIGIATMRRRWERR